MGNMNTTEVSRLKGIKSSWCDGHAERGGRRAGHGRSRPGGQGGGQRDGRGLLPRFSFWGGWGVEAPGSVSPSPLGALSLSRRCRRTGRAPLPYPAPDSARPGWATLPLPQRAEVGGGEGPLGLSRPGAAPSSPSLSLSLPPGLGERGERVELPSSARLVRGPQRGRRAAGRGPPLVIVNTGTEKAGGLKMAAHPAARHAGRPPVPEAPPAGWPKTPRRLSRRAPGGEEAGGEPRGKAKSGSSPLPFSRPPARPGLPPPPHPAPWRPLPLCPLPYRK